MLGLVASVAGVLYLLFPRQSLLDMVRIEQGNDSLTAGYIAALLRTEPGNHELRLLLAEKRFAMGQMALAREAMEPAMLAGDPLLRRRVLLLEYRILEAEAAALPAGSSAWQAAQARLRERLARYADEPWTPQQLITFAQRARALQQPALASAFNARLAASQLTVLPEWLAEAALAALGGGDYVEAARLYFAARQRETAPDARRDYFLKGVATLRSGNLLREALAAADAEIGDLRDDPQTLTYLARLALAAGDAARAQAYVKRLLRMSAVLPARNTPATAHGGLQIARVPGTAERLLDWLVAAAHAAETAPAGRPADTDTGTQPAAAASPLRPYDEALYTLAFDVFLANGNLADAWRVADAAVAQRPQDLAWRRRLAQVSEWSGKPQDALRHWLQMARQSGSGTAADEAWAAVLRLAPGLQDDEALLAAWQREAGRRPLTATEWQQLAGLYEALGRPRDGIDYLNAQYSHRRDPAILETIAALQERSGRTDDAIATLERMLAQPGPTASNTTRPALAVRLATLLFLRSDFARAYRVLQDLQAQTPAEDTAYWRLLAELAWQLQEDRTATDAYGRLQASGRATAEDVERLVQLLRPQQPAEARRMALFSWQKFRSASGLMIALELAFEQRDYAGMQALLGEVRPEDEAGLSTNSYYYTLRAGYYQGIGDRRAALAEYRRAMAARPQERELRLAYLWLLIDARPQADAAERDELRRRLREWGGENEGAWWDAYAAGYLALGEPRRALPWMARQAATRGTDYLWLANYAETLEEAGNPGMAARVRRHAWLQSRSESAVQQRRDANGNPAAQREAMLAHARLALRYAPGDGSLNAMRRLLRQDRPAPAPAGAGGTSLPAAPTDARAEDGRGRTGAPAPESALDNAVNELVLAWTLGEEQLEAARQWMWARFARRVESPAWADIGLALAERDRTRLAELLDDDKRSASLPATARIDAARELGRTRLAQTLGFAAQAREPDSDDIHLRLATDLLATASSVIVRDTLFERGVVQGHEQGARLQHWATPQLRLALDVKLLRQHTADATQLVGVPGVDRTLGFSALLRHEGPGGGAGETEVTVAARSGLGRFTSLRLTHTRPFDDRLSGSFALALRDSAPESVALGLGGHKDELSATLNWRLSGREYLSGRAWQARFHTQHDTALGSGHGLSLEAGYRIRSEYPDFNLRLSRVVSHYDADGAGDAASMALVPGATAPPPAGFFMPQSFRLWGLNAGFGTDFREQRSRALRPYADFGRTASSTSGSGYNWLLGAGGSVLGPDHLSAYWLRARGGGIGAAVREVGLRYQFYFD
jgi:hypothetical protein